MKKKFTIAITLIAVGLTLLNFDSVANALVGFALAGVVPGTHIVVPFWAMVAFWCLVITAVTTIYIENTVGFVRSQLHHDSRRKRLPRRRYGQI